MAIDGQKIKHMRNKCGLTQRQLSDQSGINLYTIQTWERKSVMPECDLTKILKIVEAMGCSMQDLAEEGQELRIKNKKKFCKE